MFVKALSHYLVTVHVLVTHNKFTNKEKLLTVPIYLHLFDPVTAVSENVSL